MNRRLARVLLGAGLAPILLGGCGGANSRYEWVVRHPLGCRLDEQRLVRDTLYFGRAIPAGREVGDADWQVFEREVLAPALPSGYTVIDGRGHWRGSDGVLRAEASRIVIAVHADDAATQQRLRAVIADYRQRFAQESVLQERGAVCVTF
ncbi:DUF3574 domain-containing protein [Dokdonella sp.]|uniref:DUF3574 domain-containing protein n=1 Tax=Dokdonella sp. TaxID=2291710 RepID=UPI0025B93EAB|nr:DUF3574 domain-containing protein [Dokdonella sp.]MBX3689146.1 DUF3574 domain-containing protein [Dokdonella sp.]